jgi:hypothetical protein
MNTDQPLVPMPPAPETLSDVFAVRAMRPGDIAFIRDSWLRSAWDVEKRRQQANGVKGRRLYGNGVRWYATHRPLVTRLLERRDGVTVWVACELQDPDHIGGWLATRFGCVEYAYVKAAYRGFGIVKMLAAAAGVEWKRPCAS